jgi:hypothetical protein
LQTHLAATASKTIAPGVQKAAIKLPVKIIAVKPANQQANAIKPVNDK